MVNTYEPGPVEELHQLASDIRAGMEGLSESDCATKMDAIAHQFDSILLMAQYEEKRPAPQVHFRVNIGGLKRVPDATFTMDGDMRDIDQEMFFEAHDRFQAEVDQRYPLPDQEKPKTD